MAINAESLGEHDRLLRLRRLHRHHDRDDHTAGCCLVASGTHDGRKLIVVGVGKPGPAMRGISMPGICSGYGWSKLGSIRTKRDFGGNATNGLDDRCLRKEQSMAINRAPGGRLRSLLLQTPPRPFLPAVALRIRYAAST